MAKTDLKNQIRRLRFEHNEMTQQELANRAGVTRQTIIAIEACKYSPSLMLAFRIARVFGLGGEEVFEYEKKGLRHELQSRKGKREDSFDADFADSAEKNTKELTTKARSRDVGICSCLRALRGT